MVDDDSTLTTRKNVNLSTETYDRLSRYGLFKESFDDLINRVLDIVDEHKRERKRGTVN